MYLLLTSRKAIAVAVPERAFPEKELLSILKRLYPVLLKKSTFFASDNEAAKADFAPELL